MVKMGKMGGMLAFAVLVVLLVSPAGADAIWSGKKDSATAGQAAKEYAKEAVRNTADAAANVGEESILNPQTIIARFLHEDDDSFGLSPKVLILLSCHEM